MAECLRLDDAALLALGLLEPAERTGFRQHLAICPACRIKAAELRAVAELLPYGAQPAEPQTDLLARILRELEVEAAPTPKRRRNGPGRTGWVAVVAVVLVGVLTGLGGKVWTLSREVAELSRRPPVVVSTGAQRVRLTATEAAPAASGDLVLWSDEDGDAHLMLMAKGLPPAAGSGVYHLWLLRDGERTSGGTFVAAPDGSGRLYRILKSLPPFDAAGVTLEPDAAGLEPRGPKVLGGQV